MKHQETFTDKIAKNINYALEAIPRVLKQEKEKPIRKAKSTGAKARKSKRVSARKVRKAKTKGAAVKRTIRAKVKSLSTRAKRGVKTAGRKAKGVMAKAKRSVKTRTSKAKKSVSARRGRKPIHARKTSRRPYTAPMMQAA